MLVLFASKTHIKTGLDHVVWPRGRLLWMSRGIQFLTNQINRNTQRDILNIYMYRHIYTKYMEIKT